MKFLNRRHLIFVASLVVIGGAVCLNWPRPTPPRDTPRSLAGNPAREPVHEELRYELARTITVGALGKPIVYSSILRIQLLAKSALGWRCEAELLHEGVSAGRANFLLKADLSFSDIAFVSDASSPQVQAALLDAVSIFAFGSDQDTTGRYAFSRSQSPSGGWLKQKTDYLDTHGRPAPRVLYSMHRADLDPTTGMPTEILGEERWRLDLNSRAIETDSTYRLTRISSLLALPRAPAPGSATAPAADFTLENRELTALWPSVGELTRSARLTLFDRTLKALRADSALGTRLLAQAHSLRSSQFLRNVIGLLATSGSPQAQQTLRDYYRSSHTSESQRKQILAAWTMTEAPLDSETRSLLIQEARSKNAPATYALGASLQHGATDPATEVLLTSLHTQARDESARILALEAIGNSGRDTFLPTLESELHNPSDRTRAKAAFALRFIPGQAADELIRVFAQDLSPKVRGAAFEAIRYRELNDQWQQLFADCIERDPSSDVRATCQRLSAAGNPT